MPDAATCWQAWGDISEECSAGLMGLIVALVVIVLLHTALYVAAKRAAGNLRPVGFMDIIVTADDNRYSLSRFQVYFWTIIVILGFAALSIAKGQFAGIPLNLAVLMGVSLSSAVVATALSKASPPSPTGQPGGTNVLPPPPTTGFAAPRQPAPPRF